MTAACYFISLPCPARCFIARWTLAAFFITSSSHKLLVIFITDESSLLHVFITDSESSSSSICCAQSSSRQLPSHRSYTNPTYLLLHIHNPTSYRRSSVASLAIYLPASYATTGSPLISSTAKDAPAQ
ncbi:hypothetical protein EDC01DRAFT_655846, partial [Geopyxis carbonaria]